MVSDEFTILLVTDDPELFAALPPVLAAEGNRVVIAASGGDAVDVARRESPDAALLDLHASTPDAYETAAALRKNVAAIVMLTNRPVEQLATPDSVGIDLVLNKPVSSELLGGLLHYVHQQRLTKPKP